MASWRSPWFCFVIALALVNCSTVRKGAGIGVYWTSSAFLAQPSMRSTRLLQDHRQDRAYFSEKYCDAKCNLTDDSPPKLDGNGKWVPRRFGVVLPLEVEKLNSIIPIPVIYLYFNELWSQPCVFLFVDLWSLLDIICSEMDAQPLSHQKKIRLLEHLFTQQTP